MSFLRNIKDKFSSGTERTVTIKKNVVGSFAIKGVSILISLMLVPATIGYVSAELYGVWLVLFSVLHWIQFLDLGFSQGLKNKLTEAIAMDDWKRAKSLVSTTYVMMTLIFVPVAIILVLLVPYINWCDLLNVGNEYAEDINRVIVSLISLVCLQMIVNVLMSVVAAFQRVAMSSLLLVIGNLLSFIAILILTKTVSPSLWSLSIAYAVLPILTMLVASFIMYGSKYKSISPSIKAFDKTLIKDIFNLGYKFFIINIQVVVLYQTTNILISNVSSPLEVTEYNIAYKYLSIAMMVFTIITSTLWPAYTDAYVKKDFEWMRNIRKKIEKVLLLSVAACAFMILVSPLVYKIWIQDKVEISMTMTCVVAIYVMIYCWMNLNGTLLVGMGTIKLETIMVVVGMIVHIPLSIFLGKYIGAYGVLTSMILVNLAYAIMFNIQTNKILSGHASGIWIE